MALKKKYLKHVKTVKIRSLLDSLWNGLKFAFSKATVPLLSLFVPFLCVPESTLLLDLVTYCSSARLCAVCTPLRGVLCRQLRFKEVT